jgi:hypothetical protein
MTDLAAFAELVPLDHGLCVINTVRGEGSVQLSAVNAGVRHPAGSTRRHTCPAAGLQTMPGQLGIAPLP